MDEKYITIEEAQKIADRSETWWKDRIQNGDIPTLSTGKGSKHLMPESAVRAYLKGQEKKGAE